MGNDGLSGRILCLDLGEKRIGVALSDETQTIARSHLVFERSSRVNDFEQIARIVDQEEVQLVIVGLPTLANGGEGEKAAWARDYASALADFVEIPVGLWDESFSTVDAQENLRLRGLSRRRKKQRLDAVAAAFILQSYLDAQKPSRQLSPDPEESPGTEI